MVSPLYSIVSEFLTGRLTRAASLVLQHHHGDLSGLVHMYTDTLQHSEFWLLFPCKQGF